MGVIKGDTGSFHNGSFTAVPVEVHCLSRLGIRGF